jgi:hypothetical protein
MLPSLNTELFIEYYGLPFALLGIILPLYAGG